MDQLELFVPSGAMRPLASDEVKIGRMNLVLSVPLAAALGSPRTRIAFLYNRESEELVLRRAAPEEYGCRINRISRAVSVVSVRKFFGFKQTGHFKARLESHTVIVSLKERVTLRPRYRTRHRDGNDSKEIRDDG